MMEEVWLDDAHYVQARPLNPKCESDIVNVSIDDFLSTKQCFVFVVDISTAKEYGQLPISENSQGI